MGRSIPAPRRLDSAAHKGTITGRCGRVVAPARGDEQGTNRPRSDTRFRHDAGISRRGPIRRLMCPRSGAPRTRTLRCRGAGCRPTPRYRSGMSTGPSKALVVPTEIACGVVAGPLFVSSFAVIGARRAGYDWCRHAVSSLAAGQGGWSQRANFALTGALYCIAAHGLVRSPRRAGAPRVVPALIFGVGVGLVNSGLFVTDSVAGFPPSSPDQDAADRVFQSHPLAAESCTTCAQSRSLPGYLSQP